MSNILVVFIFVFSVLFGGCGRSGRGPQVTAMDEESPVMITIDNFEVTDANLTLDYQISNPFDYAIWVCYDGSVRANKEYQSVSATIDDAKVRLQLRCNVKRIGGFVDPPTVAKYVRLLPGESYSGRIRQYLPIEDYVRESRAGRTEHKEIVLHRAVFEVGYFGPNCNECFVSVAERSRKEPDMYKPLIVGRFYYLPGGTFLTEELLEGKTRAVLYTGRGMSFTRKEKFVQVLITNIDIPCSVVVDE